MNKLYKFIFLSSLIIYSNQSISLTDEWLEDFERNCSTEAALSNIECIDKNEMVQSYKRQLELIEGQQEIRNYEMDGPSLCHTDDDGLDINSLGEDISAISSKVSCTPEDAEENQLGCGPQALCNIGRSATTALSVSRLGRVIASKLENFITTQSQSDQCMNNEESDCLTELFNSFFANIIGTGKSLKSLAGAAIGAIWNLPSHIRNLPSNLHSAAVTTYNEISTFSVDPIKYIVDKYNALKESVNNWMSNVLFCQKWEGGDVEGTGGGLIGNTVRSVKEFSERKCVEPANLGCLDCNDGMNAVCVGAGFFMAEVAITVGTAGTLAGARIAKNAINGVIDSTTAARTIVSRVPGLRSIADTSTHGPKQRIVGETQDAVRLAGASSTRLLSVRRYANIFENLRSNNRIINRTARIITAPTRAIDNMASRTIRLVTANVARTNRRGALATHAAAAARRDLLDAKSGVRRVGAVRRSLVASRLFRRTGSRRGNELDPTSGRNNNSERNDQSEPTRGTDDPSVNQGSSDQRTDGQRREDQRTETQRAEDQRREDQRKRDEEEEERRQQIANNAHPITDPTSRAAFKAARAAIYADRAHDALTDDAAAITEEMLSDHAITGDTSETTSSDNIKERLEERIGTTFEDNQTARRLAENMNQVYSDPSQRQGIIDNIISKRGLSAAQATNAYESEKNFYDEITRDTQTRTTQRNQPSGKQVGEIIDMAKSIGRIKETISNIKKEREIAATTEAITETIPSEMTRESAATNNQTIIPNNRETTNIAPTQVTNINQAVVATQSEEEALVEDEFIDEEISTLENSKEERTPASEDENRERRIASERNIERIALLSELMEALDPNAPPPFRNLNTQEQIILGPFQHILSEALELDDVKTLEITSNQKQYYVFRDSVSGNSIIITKDGRLIEKIPLNIFQ
jgi:hypothetical protein